ncbi:MAG TPA: hypothetical protein VFY23_12990 [Candidatus Limnocylindrales bacterium]|nr:hypothetical protein [Candidatus Limnocylindrales bacterium]
MTRDELILRTRQLIAEGERLQADPSQGALQTWLQLSDDLLANAWGMMDRYHLAWLMVGKPKGIVRGRPMTPDEEAAYVREVASQKTAALRMSLDAVERQGMPFVGETGGVGPGQGMGAVPEATEVDADEPHWAAEPGPNDDALKVRHAHLAQGSRRSIPLDPELERRLEEARRAAAEHTGHDGTGEAAVRRAPRPERLQR